VVWLSSHLTLTQSCRAWRGTSTVTLTYVIQIKGVASMRHEEAVVSSCFSANYKVDKDYDRDQPQSPGFHRSHSVCNRGLLTYWQNCVWISLIHFSTLLSRGSDLQNWSPRSTQCHQAHTVVLMSWKQIPEFGLDFGGVQPPFLPCDFRQPLMTFHCLSRLSVFSTACSS